MAEQEPQKRGVSGRLTPYAITKDRDDDFVFNVVYTANRSIKDICQLSASNKYRAAELESIYRQLLNTAKEELYAGATVEFGFANNSLGVTGLFIGQKPQFDPTRNTIELRCTPRVEFQREVQQIPVIVTGTEEGGPTITKVTDVATGNVNSTLTAGGGLNGEGIRTKVAGPDESNGFRFVNADTQAATEVPAASVLRNDPSYFSLIVPALADGKYYLEVTTQFMGRNDAFTNSPRTNRLPYVLTVGASGGGEGGGDDVLE